MTRTPQPAKAGFYKLVFLWRFRSTTDCWSMVVRPFVETSLHGPEGSQRSNGISGSGNKAPNNSPPRTMRSGMRWIDKLCAPLGRSATGSDEKVAQWVLRGLGTSTNIGFSGAGKPYQSTYTSCTDHTRPGTQAGHFFTPGAWAVLDAQAAWPEFMSTASKNKKNVCRSISCPRTVLAPTTVAGWCSKTTCRAPPATRWAASSAVAQGA